MTRPARFLAVLTSAGLFASVLFPAQAESENAGLIKLRTELDEARGLCIDIAGFRQNIDTKLPVQAHTCKSNPNAQEDEIFEANVPAPGNLRNPTYEVCLDAITVVDRGSVYVRPCSDSDTQKFVSNDSGELRPAGDSGLCVVASPSPSHPAVRVGRTPELGVTNVARTMSLAPCDSVDDSLKTWVLPSDLES